MFLTNEEALVRLKKTGNKLTMARGNFLNFLQSNQKVTKEEVMSYFARKYSNITPITIQNKLRVFEEANIITLYEANENTFIQLNDKNDNEESRKPFCFCMVCGKKTELEPMMIRDIKKALNTNYFLIQNKCKNCGNVN
jgi:Fe2+ or Zn2+ uptake regulation protein